VWLTPRSVCFLKKLCFELGLLQFASEYILYHESVLIVLAGDFVAHDTSSLPTRSSPSNAMFVGHVIMSMPCHSKGHVCINHCEHTSTILFQGR